MFTMRVAPGRRQPHAITLFAAQEAEVAMTTLAGIAGLLLILIILWDAFETIVLPRRVTRQASLARLFYRTLWLPWSAIAQDLPAGRRRERWLGYFGPLSLILLLAAWAATLVVGFALLQWALGALHSPASGTGIAGFGTDLYMSGTTFFTLGLGDVIPQSGPARLVTVAEVAVGFGLLALVIGYLPAITGAFSRREVNVSLLDERAGSPPTAFELLRRCHSADRAQSVNDLLRDWERWSAELMESHLSYPVLAYFRSQHDNQSWLAALTMVLDLSALVLVGVAGTPTETARLTFAMARHAAVDLTQVFNAQPHAPAEERLTAAGLAQMRARLTAAGVALQEGEEADRRLAELRGVYEPYMTALAEKLLMPLPPWMPTQVSPDNWQTTAWER
jgi:hypothetical protein